uniref:Uncharacterized protein n=1 Tax=Anguilla anguilla TaxID=7936 RepID=A0A0E9S2T2_ANGAN
MRKAIWCFFPFRYYKQGPAFLMIVLRTVILSKHITRVKVICCC